jgi:hypothetical protein
MFLPDSDVTVADLPSAYPLRDLFDAAVRGYSIKLTCRKCGHVRVLNAHALWWKFHKRGWPDWYRDVTRRGRCMPCFAERKRIVRNPKLELVHEAPTGEPLPMPPLHEWKREIGRRR